MNNISLAQLADWCGGALIKGIPTDLVSTISTDTRKLNQGDVFLALKGENFNGHDFIGKADEQGIACMIAAELPHSTESVDCSIVHVRDTLKALQDLAAAYRRTLSEVTVIGVTGSNGKTSTKDFLSSVLSRQGQVNATKGNLNNHIGLPLTILNTDSSHRSCVWEMGMNHPGEIEILAEIASPDAAVITNVGTAHIEHMKTREAIADEKGCLAEAVPSSGFCAMPGDDLFFEYIGERVHCDMISVGIEKGEVYASELNGNRFLLHCGDGARHMVTLPVPGRHMVVNALLAAAIGRKLGVCPEDIADALTNAQLTGGRLEEKRVNGVDFLDDSYNANPDSMRAALSVLCDSTVEGKRVAVLGFMGELGDHEESEHLALGEKIGESGIDLLVTVGERASKITQRAGGSVEGKNFDDHVEAAEFLRENIGPGDLVLVKGSRAAGMEKVIEHFGE